MPRPGETSPKKRKLSNPLSKWLDRQKAKQKRSQTDPTAEHARKKCVYILELIDGLLEVDFLHSRLPDRILTDYVDGYRICQMEWDTRALAQLLQNNRQTTGNDVHPINEVLMRLVNAFGYHVTYGSAVSAQVTLDALKVGIQDILCKLPPDQSDPEEVFLQENTAYLMRWLKLQDIAYCYDSDKQSLAENREKAETSESESLSGHQTIHQRYYEDPDFRQGLEHFARQSDPDEQQRLREHYPEVHRLLLSISNHTHSAKLCRYFDPYLERRVRFARQRLEVLRPCLNQLPDFSDPLLMKQYRQSMRDFDREAILFDQRDQIIDTEIPADNSDAPPMEPEDIHTLAARILQGIELVRYC